MEKKIIRVKVFPNARKEEVVEKTGDRFEVRVKVKPQEGRANQAVIAALAEYFKISKQDIRLIKGGKQRNKVFEIDFF